MRSAFSRYGFLLAVARTQSLREAAEVLGVTPSAVSQQLAKLEDETGAPLLERGPGGRQQLTRAGQIVAATAERIETELSSMRQRLGEVRGEVSGDIRFGTFQTAIRVVLAPMLTTLEHSHPGLRLQIFEGTDQQLSQWLASGAIDIAVLESESTLGAELPHDMQDAPLVDDPWRLVLPAGTPPPTNFAELADHLWLGVQPGGASAQAFARLQATSGGRLQVTHQYFEFSVALALVAAAQGAALLPTFALKPPTPSGIAFADFPGLGHRTMRMRYRPENLSEPVLMIMDLARQTARTELTKIEKSLVGHSLHRTAGRDGRRGSARTTATSTITAR